MLKKLITFATASCLSLSAIAFSANGSSTLSITDIVASSGGDFDQNKNDFDILLNAVITADLAEALANPEADFTVLAPNDRAFIRLAKSLGADVDTEEDAFNAIVQALTDLGDGDPIPVLTNVLLYHVLPESQTFFEVVQSPSLETLLADATIIPARFTLQDNEPDIKDPRLLFRGRNIHASNGIIQTIDRVLIPIDLPSGDEINTTITDIVAASGGEFDRNGLDYDLLLNAVLAAGLETALADPNASLTVFAPNDLAFIRLARSLGYRGFKEEDAFNFIVGALTELGEGDPIPVLTNVLLYHVSMDVLSAKQVQETDEVDTLLEGATFAPDGRKLVDNDPGITNPRLILRRSDIPASNGVIHTINRVLIPINITGS